MLLFCFVFFSCSSLRPPILFLVNRRKKLVTLALAISLLLFSVCRAKCIDISTCMSRAKFSHFTFYLYANFVDTFL